MALLYIHGSLQGLDLMLNLNGNGKSKLLHLDIFPFFFVWKKTRPTYTLQTVAIKLYIIFTAYYDDVPLGEKVLVALLHEVFSH